MSTYEMNIDTLNASLSYYQAEKFIYGSSRLGMLKDSVNVLGSAFTDTDSTNVTHTLGNKRYELSNHLGNVLTVITDKPIPHNNGGTVDYWQASIASAYDYSPFGVMLTGRTFEGKQTICEDSTTLITQKPLEEGFNSWGSWTAMGNGLVTYVSGEMQVSNPSSSKKDIGASKTFTTGTGVHNVSFEVIGNTCATVVIWPPSSTPIPIKVSVKDNYGNVVASGNYTTAGTYNLSFTPASTSATYSLEFYMTKASAFCFFRVDDVLVSYDDTTTVTVCKEVEDGYRYGFNGQEKDDQVSGKGNSYTAEFWQYDSRLGRRWNLDPVFKPYRSPYDAFSNNPILMIDPNGADDFTINKRGKIKKVEGNGTDDKIDRLIKGKAKYDKEGNLKNVYRSMEIEKGTFDHLTKENTETNTSFTINSHDKGKEIYDFIASYVDVEYGKYDIVTGQGEEKSIFNTTYSNTEVLGGGEFLMQFKREDPALTLKDYIHNHPSPGNGNVSLPNPSTDDKDLVKFIDNLFKNQKVKPVFRIWHFGRIYDYNEKGIIKDW